MVATMLAATKAGGKYATTGPLDVCKTPPGPVPVPYPNMASISGAVSTCSKVVIESKEVLVQGSKVPTSSLDEAGVAGGVKSSVNMNQAKPKMFSGKVFAKGKKMTYLGAVAQQNGSNANTVGLQVSPSQTLVLISV